MKKLLYSLFIGILALNASAQSYNDTITWQDTARAFIIHIPTAYQSSDTVPLVFAMHGLGDVASNFENIQMNPVADTANFIIVYPQALVDPGIAFFTGNPNTTAFNSGINYISGVDDVGFISALIDSISTQYNIDTTRVYACGFSMGGFMTHRLACQLSDRITAIASVSGQMAMSIPPACNPVKEVPVFHIHGTADQTVNYNGNSMLQMISVDSTLAIWRTNNGCDNSPTITLYADNEPDGFITTIYNWTNCNNNSEILLYKVDSAEHQWLYEPANDFDSAKEIWKFFSQHPKQESTGSSVTELKNDNSLDVYPNPTNGLFMIENPSMESIEIYDALGRIIFTDNNRSGRIVVDLSNYDTGIYFIRSGSNSVLLSKE